MTLNQKLSEMAEKSVTRYNDQDTFLQAKMRKCGKLSYEQGFRAALDLPEVKALVEALEGLNKHVGHDWCPVCDENAEHCEMGVANQALSTWKAFKGEEK